MTEIITVEHDPLAEPAVPEPAVVPVAVNIPPVLPIAPASSTVDIPTAKPATINQVVSAFKEVDPTNEFKNEITQRLPNVFVTDEELEQCFQLCQDQLRESKGNDALIKSLSEVVDAFYQISINTYGDNYRAFFDKNVGNLVQYVVGNKGNSIRISYPSLSIDSNADTLSGKTALRYLNKITKIGNDTKIPLWHSGLWITIEPYSEQEMLDLNLALSRNQTQLGMDTRGATFTGDDIHVVGTIVDFILGHVVNCNLKGFDRTSLHKLILSTDIQGLLAGALAAIYPAGYPVFHACVNTEKGLCNYNIIAKRKDNGDYYPDSLMDFTKILWINQDLLTAEDNMHMSAPSRSHTYEEIVSYQLRLKERTTGKNNKSVVWTSPGSDDNYSIAATFKTPNIAEYSKTSNSWIINVKKMAEAALKEEDVVSETQREERRGKILASYAATTDLVKHGGWIDYITVTEPDGQERVINGSDTINETLKNFIAIDDFKEAFEKAVQTFKEQSLIAWTGIPNFQCPSCGSGQTDPESKIPSLISINMAGYFFSIMGWRRQMRQQMD